MTDRHWYTYRDAYGNWYTDLLNGNAHWRKHRYRWAAKLDKWLRNRREQKKHE